MANGSGWGLVAGIVVGGIVAIATGGVGLLALAAFSVTSAAVSYAMAPGAPDLPKSSGLRDVTGGNGAEDIRINTSSEAKAIPVGFGINRISGNFLKYDRNKFKVKPIVQYYYSQSQLANALAGNAIGGGGKGGGDPAVPEGDNDTQFFTEKEYAESGSKWEKIGVEFQEQIIGYDYYASFDLGICLGPVDYLMGVFSSPGDYEIIPAQSVGADNKLMTAASDFESGVVNFYTGTFTQTRAAADPYFSVYSNYRGTCFAAFKNFYLGTQPQIKTFLFDVVRWPKPLLANGSAVPGLYTTGAAKLVISTAGWSSASGGIYTITTTTDHNLRAGDWANITGVTPSETNGRFRVIESSTATQFVVRMVTNPGIYSSGGNTFHDCFYDANPAAILWEVLTNDHWGKGDDPDKLHQASFEAASLYFWENNIGISFALNNQNVVADAVEAIREHTGAALIPDGEKVRLVLSSDTAQAYAERTIINSEDVNEVQVNRPSWATVTNEVRAEFRDRSNNWQTTLVHEQDLGSIDTLARMNSKKLSLRGFTNRQTAERETKRIMAQMAFPAATMTFKTNRFSSHLLPFSLVEFVWSEWSSGEAHTFWRVASITDENQDESGISVTLIEDQFVRPYVGAQEALTVPVPQHLLGINDTLDEADLSQQSDTIGSWEVTATALKNITFAQTNIFQTGGLNGFNLFIEPEQLYIFNVLVAWKRSTETEYKALSQMVPWAITGELTSDFDTERTDLNREDGIIAFSLEDEATYEATVLSVYSSVGVDADDIVRMPSGAKQIMVLNGELIYVGLIEDSGTTTGGGKKIFHAKNYLRAQNGSKQAGHTTADRVVLVQSYVAAGYFGGIGPMPTGEALDMRLIPSTRSGQSSVVFDTTHTFTEEGKTPFPPSFYSATAAGSDWTIKVRPRWHTGGASIWSNIQTDVDTLNTEIPSGYSYWIQAYNGAATNGSLFLTAATFTPDDGTTREAGLVEIAYTVPASTTSVRIFQALDGVLSTDYATATI